MKSEDLDHILSGEAKLLPSSGFADSVMQAVRRQASAPPIPFPWKQALPGLLGPPCLLAAILIIALKAFAQTTRSQAIPSNVVLAFPLFFQLWRSVDAGWILFALLASLLVVKLSRVFTSLRSHRV